MNNSYGSLYLSGPMNNYPKEKQLYWRQVLHQACRNISINTYSPMRSSAVLPPFLYSTNASIMERDLYDVRQCDMIVANLLDAKSISMGTMIELGVAYGLRKPIILIRQPDDKVHTSEMLHEMSAFEVTNLIDAFKVVASMLLPDDEMKVLDAESLIANVILHA